MNSFSGMLNGVRLATIIAYGSGFGLHTLTFATQAVANDHSFAGVVATFHVLTPRIAPNQPVQVNVTLENTSAAPVVFRLVTGLIPNIRLYDKKRNLMSPRFGPMSTGNIITNVHLDPGELCTTRIEDRLGDYYYVPPGTYYLRFTYDLRLITNEKLKRWYMTKYHSNTHVLWDTHWYRLSVSGSKLSCQIAVIDRCDMARSHRI
jgi:hypothetical protein